MKRVSALEVRNLVLNQFREQFSALGLDRAEVPDDFDLLLEGVIDSLGVVEVVNMVEEHFGIHVDFEDLDPEQITVLGPLCRYIESYSNRNGTGRVVENANVHAPIVHAQNE